MVHLDCAVSAAVTIILIFVFEHIVGRSEVREVLRGNRQIIYATGAQIAGSLTGFVIAAVSVMIVVMTAPGRGMQVLRNTNALEGIYAMFFRAISLLALATLWLLAALLIDRDGAPRVGVAYISVGIASVAVVFLYRCVWALNKTIKLAIKDARKKGPMATG